MKGGSPLLEKFIQNRHKRGTQGATILIEGGSESCRADNATFTVFEGRVKDIERRDENMAIDLSLVSRADVQLAEKIRAGGGKGAGCRAHFFF